MFDRIINSIPTNVSTIFDKNHTSNSTCTLSSLSMIRKEKEQVQRKNNATNKHAFTVNSASTPSPVEQLLHSAQEFSNFVNFAHTDINIPHGTIWHMRFRNFAHS